MKNHITFNSQFVPSVLDGSKTQTRRPLKEQPGWNYGDPITLYEKEGNLWVSFCEEALLGTQHFKCPWKVGESYQAETEEGKTFATITIKSIKVEKVADISDRDALKEGILSCPYPRFAFRVCWNSLYGKDAWERNDWVWVLEFVREDRK